MQPDIDGECELCCIVCSVNSLIAVRRSDKLGCCCAAVVPKSLFPYRQLYGGTSGVTGMF